MIDRAIDRKEIKKLLSQFPVTALIGPRQCGKTTLARGFAADHYFDLENPRDLAALQNPQLALEDLTGLIVIDEVQRLPEVFPLLRYLVDNRPIQRYLILGSASGRLLRQSSESLAGRIAFYSLGGCAFRTAVLSISRNYGCAAASLVPIQLKTKPKAGLGGSTI
jgi:predicted AAA+ superfamily ATPase